MFSFTLLLIALPLVFCEQIASAIPFYLVVYNTKNLNAPESGSQFVSNLPNTRHKIEVSPLNQSAYTRPYATTEKISIVRDQPPMAHRSSSYEAVLSPQQYEYYYLIPSSAQPASIHDSSQKVRQTPTSPNRETHQDPYGSVLMNHFIVHEQDRFTPSTHDGVERRSDRGLITTPYAPQGNSRKLHAPISETYYYQYILLEEPSPQEVRFGHVIKTPLYREKRYERNNMKDRRFQGKIKWADKEGGYGEQYWDLGHA